MTLFYVGNLFDSVQLNGHWHGTPSTVVMLINPPSLESADESLYTDTTDFPIPADPNREVSLSHMLKGRGARLAGEFSRVGPATLWMLLKSQRGRHLIVTGAEPCRYELSRLAELMRGSGWSVQIETKGRAHTKLDEHVWLTLRPPAIRDGDLCVDQDSLDRANEIVARIHGPADVDRLDKLLCSRDKPIPVWVMPVGKDGFCRRVCVDAASTRRWRVCGTDQLVMTG